MLIKHLKVNVFLFGTNFQVYQQLVEKTKSTPGARVENNKFCVSVHFRCVEEKVNKLQSYPCY